MKRKAVSGIVLMLLLTSMLSAISIIQPVKAESMMWTVDDNLQDYPDADFTKIQEAVNSAADGDAILVYPGTYAENVYVNKRLTIKSQNGAETAIVEAAYTHSHVFYVAADYVTISGFTVKGATRGPETLERAGIYLHYADYCNISNNIAMNNDYGIFLPLSSSNIITNNNANHNKHIGVYLSSSSNNNIITNNNVSNNGHGGICLSSSSNNIITNNDAWNNAGGIDILSLSSNNTITNNDAWNNTYGIHIVGSSNNKIYHNNFIDNSQQVSSSDSINTWDDGYPSGGNYWSDYTDVDLYSGPYQNETGSDGIWDHPYVIDADNQDRYPLVNPWTPTPPWPMFQHDPQHTGRSPFVGPIISPEAYVLIEGERENDYFRSPVIGSDDTLYLSARITKGVTKQGLFAFYPDGTQKWFCETPYPYNMPALFERANTVYILSLEGILAVNTANGELKWRRSFSVLYGNQNPIIDGNGMLYFIAGLILPDGSYDSCLILLGENGEAIWVYAIEKGETYFDFQLPDEEPTGTASPGPSSNPTIGKKGIIYFGHKDTLFAIDPNGTKRWQRSFPTSAPDRRSRVLTPSVGSDGTIYVVVKSEWFSVSMGEWYDCVHAIDPKDPLADKWSIRLSRYASSILAIGPDGTLYKTGLFWGKYAWSPTKYLTAIDPLLGNIKWTSAYIGGIPIVDAEGNIYTCSDNRVVASDQEGSQKWSLYISKRSGPLSLGKDGTLYVPGWRKLYAVKSVVVPPVPTQPPQPINISPANGASDVSLTPQLLSSPPLQDVNKELIPWEEIDGLWVTRVDSQWQITTVPGDYSNPVYDYTITDGLIDRRFFPELPEAWSGGYVPSGVLDYGTTYYWRVRHRDFRGVWSPWSEETSFTTLPRPPPLSVSELKDKINRELQRRVTYPLYLLNPDSFTSAVTVVWLKFTDWATQTYLTERYDELYWAGIDFDNMRLNALIKARDLLKEDDIEGAQKYLERSYTYDRLSAMSFSAAAEVFLGNLAAGEILAEGIKEGCEASVKFGLSVINPTAAKVADYIYLGVDYAVDSVLYGQEQAIKNAVVKVAVTTIFNEVEFEALGGRTIAEYTKNRIGKYMFPMLKEAFESEELQFALSKIIKEIAVEIGEEAAEDLLKSIIDELQKFNLEQIIVESLVEVRAYDSQGNVTGLINKQVKHEIPMSVYNNGTAIIFFPIESYRYQVVGTGEGLYGLKIISVVNGNTTGFTAIDIPISAYAIHQYTTDWDAISLGEEGVTVQIDSDGDGVFEHTFTSDSELTQREYVIGTDKTPPQTSLNIGEPKFVVDPITYLTSATPVTLVAEDNPGGSGVALTAYRVYNTSYNSGWITYTHPFYLIGLSDGTYYIDYNSTDYAGNVEPSNTATVVLDNTGPSVAILNPPSGWALQDGVTFIISAIDAGSGVSSLNFSIREANGGEGTPVGFEDLPATYNATTGKWTLFFDTLQLPDGYYIVLVKAKDNLGNIGSVMVPYSIRNWAVIELLPASETNKAGRTMPVKFSLRVAALVDPNQPFVYNEDLTIKIYATDDPSNILQTSTFGDTARDYRIDSTNELYITNFKTLKTPMQYTVSVYRGIFLIDSFDFSTVK